MSTTEIVMMVMITAVGALAVMTNRNKIANQALEAAVSTQTAFSSFSQQMYADQLKHAEERGAARVQVQNLRDDLKVEQERYKALVEKMTQSGIENKATIDELRTDSQKKIDALQKKIDQLETDMKEVRGRLREAEEEKERLERERDQLRRDLSGMQSQIEAKVREAVDALRDEYEGRLQTLSKQIAAKDDEIERLKVLLKEKADAESETNLDGGSIIAGSAAGGDASYGAGADSGSGDNPDSGSGGDTSSGE